MILSPPWSPISPMTAQIFDVPMSNPTMMGDELNMFFPVCGMLRKENGRSRGSVGGRLDPASRHVISHRQIERGQRAALAPGIVKSRPQARKLAPEIVRSERDLRFRIHARDKRLLGTQID